MFRKVLIAEDTDYMSSGIRMALEGLQIQVVEYAQYCDEAFLKFKKALLDKEPFDLLISDLSFIENPNPQKISEGEELIAALRELQPSLKVIVFSIEDKPYRLRHLCKQLSVNAYVWKSIHGQKELRKAISEVYAGHFFISPKLNGVLKEKESLEITEYDVFLLKGLAGGMDQQEISDALRKKGVKPSSRSSIEKRLKLLKEYFNANNPTQLVAVTKDFGLI